MTLKEMKLIKEDIDAKLAEKYGRIEIGGKDCYALNDGRMICVTLVLSYKAVVVEYADSISAAELNCFEDGDLFYLEEADTDTIFSAMLREIEAQ